MALPIILVDYDSRWPDLFEAERALLLQAVGSSFVSIEHVGSTAVPGARAKPTLDIMAAVKTLADAEHCKSLLSAIGYRYLPEYEEKIPERRFFRKGPDESPTHHLHVVQHDSEFWRHLLLFRDYLRSHPEAVARYVAEKEDLAARFAHDREHYTNGKTDFILGVLVEAEADSGRARPHPR